MKRTGTILLLAAAAALAACSRNPVPETAPSVRLTASLSANTRGTVAATQAEKAISHVDWILVDPKGTVTVTRGENASELFRLAPGEYGFMAVATLPGNAPAVDGRTIDEYMEALQVSFSGCFDVNHWNGFAMVSPLVRTTVDADAEVTLAMSRVAAKVEVVGNISFNFPAGSSADAAQKSILSVFVTNIPSPVKVCGGEQVGTSYVNDAFDKSRFIPAYVSEGGIPTDAMNGFTKWTGTGDKVFYAHPNSARQADGVEGRDHTTKLVVAASIGGTVQYYPIALPGIASNKILRVGDITISGYGSDDPNEYVQDRSGLSFNIISLVPWEWDKPDAFPLVRKDD